MIIESVEELCNKAFGRSEDTCGLTPQDYEIELAEKRFLGALSDYFEDMMNAKAYRINARRADKDEEVLMDEVSSSDLKVTPADRRKLVAFVEKHFPSRLSLEIEPGLLAELD